MVTEADKDPDEILRGLGSEDQEEGGNGEAGRDVQESIETSKAIVCNVPTALRMNSGSLEVRGGMICGISNKVEKMIVKVSFKCGQCDIINEVYSYPRPRFAYEIPSKSSKPTKCASCNDNSFRDYEYQVVNALQIELQDLDTFSDLERLPVILFDDNTTNVSTGEQVVVTGSIQKIRKNDRLLPFLFASSIRYHNRKELIITPQDVEEIKNFANGKGDVIDLLVSKFAPSVIGYEHVKKGLLLCAANSGKDSISRRLRINALLIGETGLDKSAFLRAETEIVPNSKYCSTLNSSIRSLIAVVTQENEHYMLRVGPVPAASGAICAINEIGRMNYDDQAGFLDAMQEGKIPFGKYGFNITLDGSATFIMSANPTNNSSWRNAEKIDLNEVPLISPLRDRFDLLFVFRTPRDRDVITNYAFKKTDPHMMSDKLYEEEEKNHDFIKKYILDCKKIHPTLSEEARIMLCEYYSSIAVNFGSPRILDGLIRISHAWARLRQKDVIDCEDVKEVMEFYNVVLQQLSESVTIPKNPFDLTVEEITNIVLNSEYPYDFMEAAKRACKTNESVARYIGDNFSVEHNKKLRRVRDRFAEGIDNRIVILNLKPLALVRRSSYEGKSNTANINSNNSKRDDDRASISKQEAQQPKILHPTDLPDPTDHNQSRLQSNPDDTGGDLEGQDAGSERSERSVVRTSNVIEAFAVSKKRLDRIECDRPEVKDTATVDLEWERYEGKYGHTKTKIYAACFCTNSGERIVLHISRYSSSPNPEKALIQDIIFYLNQFPLTFGWYTTGVTVYDDKGLNRIKGRDSDFFILHQRCIFHHLTSPIEVKKTYTRLKDSNKKHIDLHKVFSKPIIQNGVFEGRYRTTGLDSVSRALLGKGKYSKLNAGTSDIFSLPIEEQLRYVRRDSELAMQLAQYNNCLVLRIMKVFASYAKMDYYPVCHTDISRWYSNRYQKMLESGESTVSYTPNYKLIKQPIGGGRHTHPTEGFFIGTKIHELDVKGQYPSIVINNNFSFDTLNCTCCKHNENAYIKQTTIDTINEQLQENNIPRKVDRYWVCQKRKGAFPRVLEQTLADRKEYLDLLKEEKAKAHCDSKLIEEYQTHQLGAKLFANAGFGLFGNEYFEFANYQVAECITAEGRRIHKQMESLAQNEPYNFEVVFGFTDSTFFNAGANITKVRDFIQVCKDKLGVIVELKSVFINSIFYSKKNRYVAWTRNEKDEPIIKGLDGLSDYNPLWVRKWFKKILVQLVKHPETRLEVIPKMIQEAYLELDGGRIDIAEELKFTQRLKKYPDEYKGHVRTGILAKSLDKDKGDLVHWYETFTKVYVKSKQCWERKKGYSVKPENLNLDEYKHLLLNKLTDSLEIAGFKMNDLTKHLLPSKTMPVSRGGLSIEQ